MQGDDPAHSGDLRPDEPAVGTLSRLLRNPWIAHAIDRVLIPGLFIWMLVDYTYRTPFPEGTQRWLEYFLNIVRFSIVPILLLTSRRALESRLTGRGMLGLVLSVAVPILISPTGPEARWSLRGANAPIFEAEHAMSIVVVSVIYTLMLIVAYFNLGRNLSVTPTLKSIVTHGLYSVVRHPVYAATLHLLAIFTLIFPSPRNMLCLASLNVGLVLRMNEEEIVLSNDRSYVEYLATMKHRTYSPLVSAPLVFLVTLRLLSG